MIPEHPGGSAGTYTGNSGEPEFAHAAETQPLVEIDGQPVLADHMQPRHHFLAAMFPRQLPDQPRR